MARGTIASVIVICLFYTFYGYFSIVNTSSIDMGMVAGQKSLRFWQNAIAFLRHMWYIKSKPFIKTKKQIKRKKVHHND